MPNEQVYNWLGGKGTLNDRLHSLSGNAVSGVTDPLTGGISLIGPDGAGTSDFIKDAGLLSEISGQPVDMLDLRAALPSALAGFVSPYAAGGDATLDAMTADQRTWMAHPSVIYVPEGFAGYRYWCAVTPYPNSASAYENPCAYASNNLLEWVALATNPLVAKPAAANDYNADPFIFLSVDRTTLHIAYRARLISTSKNILRLLSTTDGVSWSAPVDLIEGAVSTLDFGSPSINWNGAAWELISHNLDDASDTVQMRVSTDATLTGGFGSPTTLTIINPLGAVNWWHSEWRLTNAGYIGLLQSGSSSGGDLFFAFSPDKVKFGTARYTGSASYYKSGFVVTPEGVRAFIGAITGGFKVYVQPLTTGRIDALIAAVGSSFAFGRTHGRLKLRDSCTRTDSASSAGSPDIGAAWTADIGTWGISTNRIYNVGTGNARLLTDAGSTSHEISATLSTVGTQTYLFVGYVDANNYIRVGINSGNGKIQSIVGGGVVVDLTIGSALYVDGVDLVVRRAGCRLTVVVGGVPLYDGLITDIALGTKCGLQGSGASASYFDNISVIDLG